MLYKIIGLLALISTVLGQFRPLSIRPQQLPARPRPISPVTIDIGPKPYQFSYEAIGEDGFGHSRTEQGDGSGAVRGSYKIQGPLGIFRIVEYLADRAGYRATIRTNEPGTDNQNPADVQITAETPPAGAYQHRYSYARGGRRIV